MNQNNPLYWTDKIVNECTHKANDDLISPSTVYEVAEKAITELIEQLNKDFDDKLLLLQEYIHKLEDEKQRLIDSCWYRLKSGKIQWKQGRNFGTSFHTETDYKSYLEAFDAIKRNAGIPIIEDEDEEDA